MKRNRRSWAQVTCFSQGVAYEFSTRKWKEYEDIKNCSSSHASFKTLRRAKKNAVALHTRLGCEVILLHLFYHKGKRFWREYYIKAKGAKNEC